MWRNGRSGQNRNPHPPVRLQRRRPNPYSRQRPCLQQNPLRLLETPPEEPKCSLSIITPPLARTHIPPNLGRSSRSQHCDPSSENSSAQTFAKKIFHSGWMSRISNGDSTLHHLPWLLREPCRRRAGRVSRRWRSINMILSQWLSSFTTVGDFENPADISVSRSCFPM